MQGTEASFTFRVSVEGCFHLKKFQPASQAELQAGLHAEVLLIV